MADSPPTASPPPSSSSSPSPPPLTLSRPPNPNPNFFSPNFWTADPSAPPPPQPPPPPPTDVPPKPLPPFISVLSRRPSLRVTTEFDSDSSVFFHKVSCKLFDSLAKLKLTCQNNGKREFSVPEVSIVSKNLSIHYDVEEQNALIKTSFDVGSRFQFKGVHDVKAEQGEVTVVTKIAEPGYALELSTPVPAVGLPRATLKFPFGQISLEEEERAEEKRALSISGLGKAKLLNGLCSAQFSEEELKLRYSYKDEALSFIPTISLPSNDVSFAFKRRFNPANKLSYWYHFDSNNWSAVYKHTYGKDFKFKSGYDSDVRLGWASLWVGDEGGKAKSAPMKMKVQFMLQVPQDDIKSSALMFRVKKRWDI